MYFVISPAKNLNQHITASVSNHTQPALLDAAASLMRESLRTKSVSELQTLMRISEKLAQLNHQRHQDWHTPFTKHNAHPAVYLFSGDVYQGLDVATLDQGGVDYLQQHLGILSGLYGLLRPLDLIQAYRLEMGTKLENSKGKHLYDYWHDLVTPLVEQRCRELSATPTLINLASEEYFKVIDTQHLNAKIITPRFEDEKNGVYKVIGFYAKKARGLMVRYAASQRCQIADELKSFDAEGYHFDVGASDAQTWVFRRSAATRDG